MNNQNTAKKMQKAHSMLGAGIGIPSSKKAKIRINLNYAGRNIPKTRIKVNKMNKFKLWFRNWLYDDHSDEDEKALAHDDEGRNYEDDKTLKFNVTTARGGVILTVRNYDQRQDRHFYTAHVLHDDQNIAEGVAQIVSMELLRS